MTAAVIAFPGRRVARQNRKEDGDTIRHRGWVRTFEAAAFADTREDTLDDRAQALSLAWVATSKLPSNNLRLLAGTLDERKDFEVRLAEKAIAEAEREAFQAKIDRVRALHGKDAAEAMYPENERLFERYRQATLDLAASPVFTVSDLRRKKAAIGQVWLTAEGAFYDSLRNGVAADEARFAAAKQGRA